MEMELKKKIVTTALALLAMGQTMTGRQLASLLNEAGHRTSCGLPYQGGRGTYRLLDATYQACQRSGDMAGADAVAMAFVDLRGRPAWE